MYLDEPRAFYDALGGGKANKNTMASFLAKMLNPFSRLKKNIKRSEGTKGNLVGEGLVHGGVYVVPPGGKPFYAHAEVELGDHPPTESCSMPCRNSRPSNCRKSRSSSRLSASRTTATLTSLSTSMSPSRSERQWCASMTALGGLVLWAPDPARYIARLYVN